MVELYDKLLCRSFKQPYSRYGRPERLGECGRADSKHYAVHA